MLIRRISSVQSQNIWLATLLCLSFLSSSCGSEPLAIGTAAGYQISLFVSGTPDQRNPDAIAMDDNGHIFIDYQNITAKDGTDGKTSTIVQYTLDGQQCKQFSVLGHSDGLRFHNGLLWALSNEDGTHKKMTNDAKEKLGKPLLSTIDPNTGASQTYIINGNLHGGGFDDLYFVPGIDQPFLSGSDPLDPHTGTAPTINTFPVVYQITNHIQKPTNNPQQKYSEVEVTSFLQGNDKAQDRVSKQEVTLNETDPDSLSLDDKGKLVLVNQNDHELVFIDPSKTQKTERLVIGTPIDDPVWTPAKPGRLLIVDAARNQTYWLNGNFRANSVYIATYHDASIPGTIGQLDTQTGVITTVASGLLKATGLLFVPNNSQKKQASC